MNRPKVILFVSTSLDGRITTKPNVTMFDAEDHPNLENILGTREDWQYFSQEIEKLHSGKLWMEGSNMLVKEGEPLETLPSYDGDISRLYEDFLPDAILQSQELHGWLAVVDGRGRVRQGYSGESNKPMIHFVSEQVPPEYLSFLQSKNIPYLIAGSKNVDLKEIMQKIYEKLQVHTIFTSSGGKLAGALIREALLDEINILINPVIIGGYQTPTLFDSPELDPPKINPVHLELISNQILPSKQIWLRYRVRT